MVLVGAVCLGGCVEREMTITSKPAGALVYVSGQEVGRTPLTMEFTYYGDYEIVLRREGYKTYKGNANLILPWYEVPPVDLLSDLAPWTYHDRRYLHFTMDKLVLPSDEQLIESAKEFERKVRQPVDK